jgi:hypothetical protein
MRAVLASVVLLLAGSGCVLDTESPNADGGACNALYTEGGLAITVTVPPGSTNGRYRIEVDAGTDALALEYQLSQASGTECVAPCEQTGDQFVIDQGVRGELVGAGIYAFVTDGSRTKGPAAANVRVLRDTVRVYEAATRPEYRTSEPNGRGCGQVSNAEISVTIP